MKYLSSRGSIYGDDQLGPSVFHAINCSLALGHHSHPLLQNITELDYKSIFSEVSLLDACIFLGPRLKKIDLSITVPIVGLEVFLEAVKSTCPALSNLHILIDDNEENKNAGAVGRAISNTVCGLSYLQEALLRGVTLNGKALVFLASLPILQKLDVSVPGGPPLQSYREEFPILPFPTLRDLCCSATIAGASEFLQLISTSSAIESLSIELSTIPPPQELHNFLTIVHQSSFRDTLTAVALYDDEEWDEDVPASHTIEAHTLSPLLQCPNLEDISFGIRYGQQAIGNSLMEDMASAWPRLRNLSLTSFYGDNRREYNINLKGLIHLAQYCRALESVRCQFDMSLPTDSMHPGNGIRIESLTHLCIGRSHITDPLAVAALLSDVFPNLAVFHYGGSEEMGNLWAVVDKLLEMKRQERSLAPIRNQDVRI
jgi:hypothetical protein